VSTVPDIVTFAAKLLSILSVTVNPGSVYVSLLLIEKLLPPIRVITGASLSKVSVKKGALERVIRFKFL
jgi:hypothetical protein